MKKLVLSCLPLFGFIVLLHAQTDVAKFGSVITKENLKQKLSIIASAEMEGRETASPGQKRAAAYIESEFKRMGLKPGNGESYQQLYPVFQDALTEKKLMVNGRSFNWDQDFNFNLQVISSGEFNFDKVVFAGYGIIDSTHQMNDYANLDVKGKLIIVLEGVPEGMSLPTQGGMRAMIANPGSTYSKMKVAMAKGAAGLFYISSNFPLKTASPTKGNMYLKRNAITGFVTGNISPEIASALTGRTEILNISQIKQLNKREYQSEIKITVNKATENLESSNVIAILPGTDKKEEYLMLTGHYDHLGKKGDVIYYGADDDGSGTVGVMQMAEAFTAAAKKGKHPRRNIVFMTVSGEEKGLWGSDYYSEHPIYPMEKTTADLNTDMVGRIDTERMTSDSANTVYVIGHDKLSSELQAINEAANNQSSKLVLDYKYDDPADKNNIYYRSDHYNFAKKGVPILFFYDGMLQADYHKPTDTIEKINFDLMQKRVLMIFYTAWEIANRDNMLKRDMKLNMPSR